MKYIVLTTKHHDGFCLWDTKQTDYNIMNTPFKRDVVKELAAACKKGGIAFGTYYSTCDWHHPDFPLTSPGGKWNAKNPTSMPTRNTSRPRSPNFSPTTARSSPSGLTCRRNSTPPAAPAIINMARAIQPDIVINNRTGHRATTTRPSNASAVSRSTARGKPA